VAAFYNEIDPYAAQWLRNLIAAGHIAPGVVDERSIEDVRPDELTEYAQCHFFAGIGGWAIALRRAGWADDRPVWSGSCPCQPFSATGKGAGFADQRHLWPSWLHILTQCRPSIVFGEQVAGEDADPWIDLVQDDLEALEYAFGAVPFPACGAGSPQIRERLYWVADASGDRWGQEHPNAGRRLEGNQAQGLAPGSRTGAAYQWLAGLDERKRPIQPGLLPLVDGFPGLMDQLRAYGNAIDVGSATLFIESVMETTS
jgi:DNA (cytosine-5)-methyltransferase 1